MKTRWHVNKRYLGPLAGCWGFLGFVLWITAMGTRGCYYIASQKFNACGLSNPQLDNFAGVSLGLWLGPFVAALLVAMLYCLWASVPRRVTEPVTKDARHEHTGEDEGMETRPEWRM